MLRLRSLVPCSPALVQLLHTTVTCPDMPQMLRSEIATRTQSIGLCGHNAPESHEQSPRAHLSQMAIDGFHQVVQVNRAIETTELLE